MEYYACIISLYFYCLSFSFRYVDQLKDFISFSIIIFVPGYFIRKQITQLQNVVFFCKSQIIQERSISSCQKNNLFFSYFYSVPVAMEIHNFFLNYFCFIRLIFLHPPLIIIIFLLPKSILLSNLLN